MLVVEADPVRREGLVACISKDPHLGVDGAGPDLVRALGSDPPSRHIDILLINVDQGQADEARFWATLHLLLPPSIRIVALSHGTNERVLEMVLAAGAVSLYPPDADPERICQAVKNAWRGVMDYHPSLAGRIKFLLMRPHRPSEFRIGDITLDRRTGQVLRQQEPVRLTYRERQVLSLLGEGKTNRQIARALNVRERTVAFHVSNILKKLGVSSRVEAGLVAQWLENEFGASRSK